MLTHMLKWKVVLMVALIIVGLWGWVPLASAGAREVKPKAPVPQTGQTECWDVSGNLLPSCDNSGQDGDLQAGVAWPIPRFTNRGDGTVRDNLTGLIWLRHASCFGPQAWEVALQAANTLHDSGTPETTDDCGLLDGSAPGDWRMPQFKEMHSLVDLNFVGPALSNAAGTARWSEGDAFIAVEFNRYWTSSTYVAIPSFAWGLYMNAGGNADGLPKSAPGEDVFVWPVHGGD